MLTLRRCRELLPGSAALPDAEIERVRDHLRTLAELAVDGFLNNGRRAPETRPADEYRPSLDRGDDEGEPRFTAALRFVATDERYAVEERAAIMQHDAGFDRDHAERRAVLHVVRATREK